MYMLTIELSPRAFRVAGVPLDAGGAPDAVEAAARACGAPQEVKQDEFSLSDA